MMILQFQLTNTTDNEQDLIPSFCNFICDYIYAHIDTKINRRKIGLRLNYILDEATWVNWNKDKYDITVSEIMEAIHYAICYEQYRNNIWRIQIDASIPIPYSSTSIDRLVRFLNYGDNYERATGMFTNLEHKINHTELNRLWLLFIMKNLGYMSQAKIITRN
jgi:hypothetical protein